jgi:hypothetical protein
MISFSNINKQYGKQLLFVDASFQLNPGEKVGWSVPMGRARQRYSVWWSARKLPTRARWTKHIAASLKTDSSLAA